MNTSHSWLILYSEQNTSLVILWVVWVTAGTALWNENICNESWFIKQGNVTITSAYGWCFCANYCRPLFTEPECWKGQETLSNSWQEFGWSVCQRGLNERILKKYGGNFFAKLKKTNKKLCLKACWKTQYIKTFCSAGKSKHTISITVGMILFSEVFWFLFLFHTNQ